MMRRKEKRNEDEEKKEENVGEERKTGVRSDFQTGMSEITLLFFFLQLCVYVCVYETRLSKSGGSKSNGEGV